jgi:cytochrome P450
VGFSSTGIPFLGSITSFGKQPHITILKWKELYGDTFGFYSGKKPTVVLSNFNTVKKVFADDAVTGRDTESVVRTPDSVLPLHAGLIFSQGNLWKIHRRFALSTLRDLGMGKNWLEDTIIAEVEGLCQTLKETNEKPFNPKVHLTNSVSNVICALIFGKRFSLTDPTFTRLTKLISENIEGFKEDTVAQAMPFLLWFPNAIRNTVIQTRQNFISLASFLKERVQEHDSTPDRQSEVSDYLFAYQKEKESGSKTSEKETFNGISAVIPYSNNS